MDLRPDDELQRRRAELAVEIEKHDLDDLVDAINERLHVLKVRVVYHESDHVLIWEDSCLA